MSFVYTQLSDETVMFISHLFIHGLHDNQFYYTHKLDPIMCYHSESEET